MIKKLLNVVVQICNSYHDRIDIDSKRDLLFSFFFFYFGFRWIGWKLSKFDAGWEYRKKFKMSSRENKSKRYSIPSLLLIPYTTPKGIPFQKLLFTQPKYPNNNNKHNAFILEYIIQENMLWNFHVAAPRRVCVTKKCYVNPEAATM